MSYLRRHPGAMRAYRARWADLWRKRCAAGAASTDEEETERKTLLLEVAGVSSSTQLDHAGYSAVMLAMAAEIGSSDRETTLRDPERAKRIAKIEHVAATLRPDDGESYILGLVARKFDLSSDRAWRTALRVEQLEQVMLDLISQARRQGLRDR